MNLDKKNFFNHMMDSHKRLVDKYSDEEAKQQPDHMS